MTTLQYYLRFFLINYLKGTSPHPQSKRYSPCLNEKFEILKDKENNLLNKKIELILKCRHQNKYILQTLASKIQNPYVT